MNFAFVLAFCASGKEGWLEDPASVRPVISVITDFGHVREFTGKKRVVGNRDSLIAPSVACVASVSSRVRLESWDQSEKKKKNNRSPSPFNLFFASALTFAQ